MTTETPDLHKLDDQFCFAVYSASLAINRAYKPVLDSLGLTYPQYLVLMVLWQQDGQSVGAIGERLLLDSSTLTPLLKRLETAELIRRDRNPQDERQVLVTLTRKGRTLKEKAKALPAALLCAAGVPVEELVRMKSELLQVRDNMVAAPPADPVV
jgi:DNA-binding MarR family transcriptional regulator